MTDTPRITTGVQEAYLLILSTGPAIPFDPEELEKVRAAIRGGKIATLKRGMFNPSFFVSVVQDEKRYTRFLEDTKYPDERSRQKRLAGMRPLSDLFADHPLALPNGRQLASARDG